MLGDLEIERIVCYGVIGISPEFEFEFSPGKCAPSVNYRKDSRNAGSGHTLIPLFKKNKRLVINKSILTDANTRE